MKVLVVDDNDINLEIQAMMLESCGLEVTTAESGEEAIKLASRQEFSMIFMDIQMPEMDGYRACQLLRENNIFIPVIALSADEPDYDGRYRESGMSGFLMKPLQLDDLKILLRQFITIKADEKKNTSENVIFDYDGLISVIKDEKAVLKLLSQFLSVHGRDCEFLTEKIRCGDFLGAREIMHNIKGISGNLFCRHLYKLSCRLNNELKRECSDSLDEFSEIWDITFDTLEECYNSLNNKYPVSAESTADWSELWEEFISLSREFDISAADKFNENIQSFMANMSAEDFKNLKKAVQCYDFLWISDNC